MKTSVYPEYIALLIAARLTGRPVHWMSDRTEAFLADNQARDTVTDAELALDAKGRFLALRVKHLAGIGAYIAAAGANIQTMNFARCFPCAYDIPKMSIDVRCVFTNTLPTGPYRGAGRPEANYAMERLVEEAARVSSIDAVDAPPPQPDRAVGDAVQDRDRYGVRQRQFHADPAGCAGRERLQGFRQAAQGGAARGKTARHRCLVLPRARGRAAA